MARCKKCGKRVEIGQTDEGQWLTFERRADQFAQAFALEWDPHDGVQRATPSDRGEFVSHRLVCEANREQQNQLPPPMHGWWNKEGDEP